MFREHFTSHHTIRITREIIKKCDLCQRCKDNNKQCLGATKAIVPEHKGDLVSADYYRPLVTSTAGVKYILVLIDNFTKYVKLYTLKRATTRGTIIKLKDYIEKYGKPRAILTDNGTQFTTSRWQEGLAELGIQA